MLKHSIRLHKPHLSYSTFNLTCTFAHCGKQQNMGGFRMVKLPQQQGTCERRPRMDQKAHPSKMMETACVGREGVGLNPNISGTVLLRAIAPGALLLKAVPSNTGNHSKQDQVLLLRGTIVNRTKYCKLK